MTKAENLFLPAYIHSLKDDISIFQVQNKEVIHFLDGLDKTESWAILYLFKVFQKKGIFASDSPIHKLQIEKILQISPELFRLLDSLLEIFIRWKYIEETSHASYVIKARGINEVDTLNVQKNEILQNYPEIKANFNFLEQVLEFYPELVSGRKDFLSIMFPDGSCDVVEEMYKSSFADYYNELASVSIIGYARAYTQRCGGLVSICEVGAGIGSTTVQLLPKLKALNLCQNYHYTDISKAFVQYGKKHLSADYGFVSFNSLDIERDPKLQGFSQKNYDVVLATNVLHATANILKTLEYVKSLLKPGGVLILNEGVVKRDYSTLAYGLAKGWWLYADNWRICGSPFITLQNWIELLNLSGFNFLISYNNLLGLNSSYQDVILAEAIGV